MLRWSRIKILESTGVIPIPKFHTPPPSQKKYRIFYLCFQCGRWPGHCRRFRGPKGPTAASGATSWTTTSTTRTGRGRRSSVEAEPGLAHSKHRSMHRHAGSHTHAQRQAGRNAGTHGHTQAQVYTRSHTHTRILR